MPDIWMRLSPITQTLAPISERNTGLLIDALFDLHWKRVKEVILHNEAASAEEAALTELCRQTIQTVSLKFQVCQLGQLTNFLRNGGDTVVAEAQVPQFGALEQLLGDYLNFVACNGKMLEVLQETNLQWYYHYGVVAYVEVPQLEERE